jgi:hypothetical protein
VKAFSFLRQRFLAEPGYKPHDSESWVLNCVRQPDGFQVNGRIVTMGWLTGLWRSPSGKVFVSEATSGQVYLFPEIDNPDADSTTYELEGALTWVFGFDDSFVLTWGSTYEGDHLVHRWNGKGWVKFPSPPFRVRAMHGTSPDFLVAVGTGGGIARFDGRSWKQFPSPTSEVPGKPLLGVAKWNKTVWVAGGTLGLFRRPSKGKALEHVNPKILANGFDVRKDLLISTANSVATSTDGVKFIGTKFHALLVMREGKQLEDSR